MFKQIFCWHLEGQWRKWQDPDPDPLVRGMSGSTPKCHGSATLVHCLGKWTWPVNGADEVFPGIFLGDASTALCTRYRILDMAVTKMFVFVFFRQFSRQSLVWSYIAKCFIWTILTLTFKRSSKLEADTNILLGERHVSNPFLHITYQIAGSQSLSTTCLLCIVASFFVCAGRARGVRIRGSSAGIKSQYPKKLETR